MVFRMPSGVRHAQPAPTQLDLIAILQRAYTIAGHGCHAIVQFVKGGLTVDLRGTGNQLPGVDHMPGAPRMDQERGVGAHLYKDARAARMIEVNMGRDHVANLCGLDRQVLQGGDDVREASARSRFDEHPLVPIAEQIAAGDVGLHVKRVDAVDVAFERAVQRCVHRAMIAQFPTSLQMNRLNCS